LRVPIGANNEIIQSHWPAFNVADSAIVVGALLLVGEILFSKSPAEEKALSGGSD
jgi:lipoprotein signal peptidase